MGRSRATKPQQDSEHRYYVTVYPSADESSTSKGRRLHLLTKDRNTANLIFRVLRKPWENGDFDECLRRRNDAKKIMKKPAQ